jgi:hypothetical protein
VPHWRIFNLLRTHLVCDQPLTGDVAADRETIVRALKAGAMWLHCPSVAPAHGSRLWAERSDGSTVAMGAEGAARRSTLRLRLPHPAEVKVVRNGEAIHAERSAGLDLDVVEPGAYRIEARIEDRFWLLSNPIHLRPDLDANGA